MGCYGADAQPSVRAGPSGDKTAFGPLNFTFGPIEAHHISQH